MTLLHARGQLQPQRLPGEIAQADEGAVDAHAAVQRAPPRGHLRRAQRRVQRRLRAGKQTLVSQRGPAQQWRSPNLGGRVPAS